MAKERMVNTRIWSDSWVSELDPIEKLLFMYFLTNSYTNISGIYELPMKVAAVETGIDPSMFGKILPRLEPKIIYRDGWVIMPNFPRYQNLRSKDVVLGIQREFSAVPERIKKEAMGGGWGEGLGMVSDTKPNLTKLNTPVANAPVFEVIEVSEVNERPKKEPRADLEYEELCKWLEYLTGAKIINRKKQYAFLKKAKGAEISKTRLKNRAEELFLKPFHQENGLDWGMVVSSFDRKA